MNLRFVKSLMPSETEESGSYAAKDASTWVMLLGILRTGRERHTIAVTQIGKMETTTQDHMDAEVVVTKENSFNYEKKVY